MDNAIAKPSKKEAFLAPLLKANPLFVLVLGTCPALAVTTTLEQAIGMGILFTVVLALSNVIISALRKFIPEYVRIPSYIVIIATFVTVVKLLAEAFLPELYSSLGVFLSLITVNCIVLGRAEAFAQDNPVLPSLLDGLGNGLGYTIAICIIALFREILGAGTLSFGKTFTFIPEVTIHLLKGDGWDYSLPLLQQPTGAFLVLGIVIAIIAVIVNFRSKQAKIKKEEVEE